MLLSIEHDAITAAEQAAARELVPYRVYRFSSGKGAFRTRGASFQPAANPLPEANQFFQYEIEEIACSFPLPHHFEQRAREAAEALRAMADYANGKGAIAEAANYREMRGIVSAVFG